jgi:hypothetical protein
MKLRARIDPDVDVLAIAKPFVTIYRNMAETVTIELM